MPQFPHLQAQQAWWFFSFTRVHGKLLAHHAFREVTKWGKVGDSAGKHNNVMNLSPARWQVNLAIWSPFEPVNKPQGAKSSQPVNELLYRRSGWQHRLGPCCMSCCPGTHPRSALHYPKMPEMQIWALILATSQRPPGPPPGTELREQLRKGELLHVAQHWCQTHCCPWSYSTFP